MARLFGQPDAEPESARRSISLQDHGVRLFVGRVFNHDYLWFSATEISKRSETIPVLHNYALTYALGDFSYWQGPPTPRYESDLDRIQLYAVPSASESATRTRLTYNAVNSRTLRTDDKPGSVNAPDLGQRTYVDPIFDTHTQPDRGFIVYVFVYDGTRPKSLFRLGKKGAALRARWTEVNQPRAIMRDAPVESTHPVNPLDVGGEVVTYEPVMMPPHLLLRRAQIQKDWFVFAESDRSYHRIHVPKRVLTRLEERG
jgi:CRISPR-associated protein Csc1